MTEVAGEIPFWIPVKWATGQTIDDLGQNKVCSAATTRVKSDTYWSYYKDVADPKRVIPFDAACEVDKSNLQRGGVARHIKLAADFLGFTLVRTPQVLAATDDVAGLLAAAKETTEAVAAGWAARADGVITVAERAHVVAEVDQAIVALLEFKAALLAGQGAP